MSPNRPAAPDPAAAAPTAGTTAAVVLAGGTSRRWEGRDKTAALLTGRPVLSHLLDGLPAGIAVVVVGPAGHPAADGPLHRAGPPPRWTCEQPPGGGPAAGLAAGVAALPDGAEVVLVFAGDLPFAGPAGARLGEALTAGDARADGPGAGGPDAGGPAGPDGVIGRDPAGRDQPLLAAYRLAPLRAALGPPGAAAGRSMREVLARLRLARAPVSAREAFDLDTPRALAAAEALLAADPRTASRGLPPQTLESGA